VNSVRKVPFLGSLPVVGWLFRDTIRSKQRTNLLLFLTPYIIRDEADYRRIYERKRKEQDEFMRQFYGRLPEYQVQVDLDRKAGPYSRIRRGVGEEERRIEHGGPGLPGEGVVVPPSTRLPGGVPAEPEEIPLEGEAPLEGEVLEETAPAEAPEEPSPVLPAPAPPGQPPPANPPAE
jgi:general secretion pathway protein D